jgi:hypothetical protein
MKKLAILCIVFILLSGCSHIPGKDCAKFVFQVGAGTTVLAATGIDVIDYDPFSTNVILSYVALDATIQTAGYFFDEATKNNPD